MRLETVTEGFRTLLLRGLLAGLIAGLIAGAVAFVLGEPHVEAAIVLEETEAAQTESGQTESGQTESRPVEPDPGAGAGAETDHHGGDAGAVPHDHDAATTPGIETDGGHSHGDDALVSRTGQRAGLFLATTLAGLALGAIVAVAVHVARRYTTLPGPLLGAVAAGCGWLAVEAVPFFKYPANPPAVGDPDTINERTLLWAASVLLGLLAIAAAVYVGRLLRNQDLQSVRVVARVATFLVIVAVGYVALPGVDEVGEDFPATLLWQFRISSLATQTALWAALGLAFAFLTERAQRRQLR